VRRRDFTIGLALAGAARTALALEPAKEHRIAIVIPAGPVTSISETGVRAWRAFFEELRRLGDIEGENLAIERYSGEGRPEGYADLARAVVNRRPEVIVAANDATAKAARAATATIPIVWVGGDPIQAGFATSLARPGGNITGSPFTRASRSGGSACRSSRRSSPRHPGPPFRRLPKASSFAKQASDCISR
jgi:putative ABC transport system substrate-binding protein